MKGDRCGFLHQWEPSRYTTQNVSTAKSRSDIIRFGKLELSEKIFSQSNNPTHVSSLSFSLFKQYKYAYLCTKGSALGVVLAFDSAFL